jgi:2-methylcitrate dehydratase PrpD
MMTRVQTILDPEIERLGFDKIRSVVEVDLKDGTHLVQEAANEYRGGPDRPFTVEELHEKFTECAEAVLSPSAIRETLRVVESIEEVSDIRDLVKLLSIPASDAVSSVESR